MLFKLPSSEGNIKTLYCSDLGLDLMILPFEKRAGGSEELSKNQSVLSVNSVSFHTEFNLGS